MRIEVTQKDIDAGRRKDCDKCPIALAIKRQTGHSVAVSIDDVIFDDKTILLPANAVEFISRFDDRIPVQPFSFDLPL